VKKLESFKRLILLSMSGVCLGVQILIYAYFWQKHFFPDVERYLPFWERGHWLIIGIYAVLMMFFSSMYGGSRVGYKKNSEVIFSQAFATLAVNVITYFQLSLMVLELYYPPIYAAMMVV